MKTEWVVYEWDEINGEDFWEWNKSEEELRKTILEFKYFVYALNLKTREIIKNDKIPHPDWVYMREIWGAYYPGVT